MAAVSKTNENRNGATRPVEGQPLKQAQQDIPLCVSGVAKSFAGPRGALRKVLTDINIQIARGEFVSIVGPSGTGKTTLLRCISGLTQVDSGTVTMDGVLVRTPPEGLAVVVQDYSRSLLPWMRVRDNVTLPLRVRGVPKRQRNIEGDRALESVGLGGDGHLFPGQMSGGMQQRVAIARAFIRAPRLLLMDEPFAAVDAQTRLSLEDLTLRLRDETNTSVLFITHDIDEAIYMSDRVIVMAGSPSTIIREAEVPLERPRDQVQTRRDSRYIDLRTSILEQVLNL